MDFKPIHLNQTPGEEYHTKHRFWQGCPSILRTPGGRLYAAWYSGGFGEPDPENYNLLIRSDDDGWTWSQPEMIVPSEPKSEFIAIDIQLWLDPLNRMWMFITQRYLKKNMLITDADHMAVWASVCDDPDAEILEWQQPRFISTGFLRSQPTALTNGDWVLCAYDWSSENYRYSRSRDQGKTWERCEAGKKTYMNDKERVNFDETMIFERNDHSLVMFARDSRPLIVQCTSPDLEGSSWTPGNYVSVLSSTSRFYVRRLKSGRILLIHNNALSGRSNMYAQLSEDDGKTWKYSLLLDPAESVTYPDAVEADDGRIFIIYDYGRTTWKEIRMAQITEADIINGKLCDHSSYLSRIINKAPGTPIDQALFEQIAEYNQKWKKEIFLPLHGIMP